MIQHYCCFQNTNHDDNHNYLILLCQQLVLINLQTFCTLFFNVHYRAHDVFLYAIYVVVGGKGNWGVTSWLSMLLQKFYVLYLWLCLHAGQLSSSTVHGCLRGLEMYCTNGLNNTCKDILSVQECETRIKQNLYLHSSLECLFIRRTSRLLC